MIKKIIVCSPQLGISPESNSGGEVYDREVIINLAKKGVNVSVLLPKNCPYPIQKNLEITYAPFKHMLPSYIFNFLVFPYLMNTYKKKKFDILRIHSPYFVGPAAIFFKKFHPTVPLVASYLHVEENNRIFNMLDNNFINSYDHIIAISNYTRREIIEKYNIDKNLISVVYPGVRNTFIPSQKSQFLEKKFHLAGKKILMFFGGLKPRKNPIFLIEILKKIKKADLVLVLAGEGPLKVTIEKKAKRLGLVNRIIFTGFVSEEQKPDYYNLADIVLLPSLKEGFGMIAAEAQACGKPVIISDNSSLPEVIIDGKTGFLAKTKDTFDWFKKINLLLDNESMRNRFGANATNFVKKKFSWEVNTSVHLRIFDHLLHK